MIRLRERCPTRQRRIRKAEKAKRPKETKRIGPQKNERRRKMRRRRCKLNRSLFSLFFVSFGYALRSCFVALRLRVRSNSLCYRRSSAVSFLCGFRPQTRIVLPFENPPEVLRPVGRLAHEVPAGIQECLGRLHLGGGLAGTAGTNGLP